MKMMMAMTPAAGILPRKLHPLHSGIRKGNTPTYETENKRTTVGKTEPQSGQGGKEGRKRGEERRKRRDSRYLGVHFPHSCSLVFIFIGWSVSLSYP